MGDVEKDLVECSTFSVSIEKNDIGVIDNDNLDVEDKPSKIARKLKKGKNSNRI